MGLRLWEFGLGSGVRGATRALGFQRLGFRVSRVSGFEAGGLEGDSARCADHGFGMTLKRLPELPETLVVTQGRLRSEYRHSVLL